jgi:hypothetical protein
MMLRVSSKVEGEEADLNVITQGSEAHSGVPAESELLALVEAALDDQASEALAKSRTDLAGKLGEESLIDAAAVIGNFQRMTRIADGTGIPLDDMVATLSYDLREDLGLNEFGSAGYTPKVGLLKRTLVRILEPIVISRMRKQFSRT